MGYKLRVWVRPLCILLQVMLTLFIGPHQSILHFHDVGKSSIWLITHHTHTLHYTVTACRVPTPFTNQQVWMEKLVSWGLVTCLIKSFARCLNNAGEDICFCYILLLDISFQLPLLLIHSSAKAGTQNQDRFFASSRASGLGKPSCIAWEEKVSGVEILQTARCHPTYLASLPFQYPLKRELFKWWGKAGQDKTLWNLLGNIHGNCSVMAAVWSSVQYFWNKAIQCMSDLEHCSYFLAVPLEKAGVVKDVKFSQSKASRKE